MNTTEVRSELEALLKDIRMKRVTLADARLRVDILAELVRLAELEARAGQCPQGRAGKDL